MNDPIFATLEAFLAAPVGAARALCPPSLAFTFGGTRRQAVLEGVEPLSPEYMEWSRRKLIGCFDVMFDHGCRHLWTALYTANQAREPAFQKNIVRWISAGAADAAMLAAYAERGWRVRLAGTDLVPALAPIAELLVRETPAEAEHTLWWFLAPSMEALWQQALGAALRAGATTQAAAIRSLYGEDVPPIELFVSFGKPTISADLLPPLLYRQTACYWDQALGYALTAERFRRILYDFAITRQTGGADKEGRAEQVRDISHHWQSPPILGEGRKVGPFWLPAGAAQDAPEAAE